MSESENNNPTPAKTSWGRPLVLVLLLAGLAAFFAFDLQRFLSFEALAAHSDTLRAWSAEHYLWSVLAFIGLYILSVTFSLPGAVWLSIGGGYLFGILAATAYVVFGATIGATIIFLLARYAFADWFRKKVGRHLAQFEKGFNDNALSYLLVLRLVPLFPFWLVNLAPAFLGIPTGIYVLTTFIGIIPGAFVYVSVGNGLGAVLAAGESPDLGIILDPQILTPILGLAALALIPVAYKKIRQRNTNRTATSDDQP